MNSWDMEIEQVAIQINLPPTSLVSVLLPMQMTIILDSSYQVFDTHASNLLIETRPHMEASNEALLFHQLPIGLLEPTSLTLALLEASPTIMNHFIFQGISNEDQGDPNDLELPEEETFEDAQARQFFPTRCD